MQWKLGGFPDGTNEQEQTDGGDHRDAQPWQYHPCQVMPAVEDVLIMESTIPSCRVIAGILDGEKDNRMLQDKNYKSKLAAGIYQGIVEAFEELGDK